MPAVSPNRHLNYYCSRFLHQVHEHSAENKMTADNLALVFGPNILSPEVRILYGNRGIKSLPHKADPYVSSAVTFASLMT
jgi:hypothetical protein